jgi:hypothetical protein
MMIKVKIGGRDGLRLYQAVNYIGNKVNAFANMCLLNKIPNFDVFSVLYLHPNPKNTIN